MEWRRAPPPLGPHKRMSIQQAHTRIRNVSGRKPALAMLFCLAALLIAPRGPAAGAAARSCDGLASGGGREPRSGPLGWGGALPWCKRMLACWT